MKRLLNLLEHLAGLLFKRIEASTRLSTLELSAFRLFFGLFLLLFATPFYGWIADAPPTLFHPPLLSLAYLFPGFPEGWIFRLLDQLALLLIAAITIGVRARVAGIALVIICLFANSFHYSFGKIDHDILLWITLLCCSLTNWGTRSALIPDRVVDPRIQKRSLAILGICIAFGMLTAGMEKLLLWVDGDLSTSGVLSWFYGGYFGMGRTHLFADQLFHLPPFLLELGDYAAAFFECSAFLFLLGGKRSWLLWLIGAAFFHLANTLLLNIPFHLHIAVYGPFLLGPLLGRVFSSRNASFSKAVYLSCSVAAVLLTAAHSLQRLTGHGSSFLFLPKASLSAWFACTVSALLWSALIAGGLYTLSTFCIRARTRKSPIR